jgi:hypothetical protein
MTTHVTETAARPSELAIKHFQDMLAFETDCWDVRESLKSTLRGQCLALLNRATGTRRSHQTSRRARGDGAQRACGS